MRIFLFLLLGTCCLVCTGCATMGKVVIESMFDSVFHTNDDDDDDDCYEENYEIDPYILKRKGIEPGSKRHKRLISDEIRNRKFHRRFRASGQSTPSSSPQTFEELIRSSH